MSTRQFIDQITDGDLAQAKETLDAVLSSKAFASLDEKKVALASGIFGGISEASESDDDEDEDKDDEDEDKKEDDEDEEEDK